MRIGNLNINSDMKTILDRFIADIKRNGYPYFSRGYKDSGDYFMVQCPYHKLGQEKHPSAQFRKSDGLFYCHGCKEAHSFQSVIYHCLDVSGKSWLLNNFDGSESENREIQFDWPVEKEEKHVYVDKSVLAEYRYTHPYMYKRKLNLETIRKFDIGYDADYTMTKVVDGKKISRHIGECITFPNKDVDGNILFIARRAIHTKFFHYPEDVDKPVYGLYEIYREMRHDVKIEEVYVCESMINCLTLWSWGKYAVALNGTGSSKQLEQLKKTPFRHFILALDPDDAGRSGTKKLINALTNKFISVVDIPEGKDVNDLTKEEFESLNVHAALWG